MTICVKLGKDNSGHPWVAEIEQSQYFGNKYSFHFWGYSAYIPQKRRDHPRVQAIVIVESSSVAKLEFVEVDVAKRRLGIGSLILGCIEHCMAQSGIDVIYGDISDDPSLYYPYFSNLASYLKVLRHFYTGHGWTWQLFGAHKPKSIKNPHAIGRVEKRIGR